MSTNNAVSVLDTAGFEIERQAALGRLNEIVAEALSKLGVISGLTSSAESAATAISEIQKSGAALLADVQSNIAATAAATAQVIAVKTQIADDQAVIATKSAHIQQAQEHADKVRSELDRALVSANQHVTEAEGLKSRAQSATDSAAGLLIDVKTTKATADVDKNAITVTRSEAEAAFKLIEVLSEKSTKIDERVAAYEKQLDAFNSQCSLQLQTIVDLLPGATSAGLAHAFDQRRQTFLKPSVRWQWLFVGSVVVLSLLSLSGLWNVYNAAVPLSYDELLRLWLARLPIAAALIWLALYAGHESALAKRLEEDYGYKAAIASSFLGFHKQMSEIGEKAGSNAPLAQLCGDTLATIGSPPGRIYDKHKLTGSLSTEIADITKTTLDSSGIGKLISK
jgi:hypothetical protein